MRPLSPLSVRTSSNQVSRNFFESCSRRCSIHSTSHSRVTSCNPSRGLCFVEFLRRAFLHVPLSLCPKLEAFFDRESINRNRTIPRIRAHHVSGRKEGRRREQREGRFKKRRRDRYFYRCVFFLNSKFRKTTRYPLLTRDQRYII